MKIINKLTIVLAIQCLLSAPVLAQRGGDRSGFGGSRGGFASGPPAGFGGRSPVGFGGGPPGSPGGPGGRFGSMMDRNGDGRIDQDEINQMPEGFRSMMESRGMKIQPNTSVEDFRNNMMQQFQKMRAEGGFGPPGSQPGRPSEDSQANRTEYSPSAPFRPRSKERVTVDLPPKYSELDLDYDGQIGLYEWITARRESIDQFDDIDENYDGILTPLELKLFDETSESGTPQVASFKRDRLTIIGGSGSSADGKDGRSSGGGKMSKEERAQQESVGKRYFGMMDRDRDGKVSVEEWSVSRRLKPMFEGAGIKIEAMSEDEFAKKYVKALEKSRG